MAGDDLTGGYILRQIRLTITGSDEYFQIKPSVHYENSDNYRFTYVYPKHDEIVPEQKNYIKKFLTDVENSLNGESFSDPVTGFRKYLDVKAHLLIFRSSRN